MPLYLVIAGGVVISVLTIVAASLHWKLYKLKKSQEQQRRALREDQLKQRSENLQSIAILLRAMMAGQVSLTEACMRVSVLMETLLLSDEEKTQYISFYRLATATAHIPILEEWKALAIKKKREYDKERESHEAKFRDFVHAAAETFLKSQPRYEEHIKAL